MHDHTIVLSRTHRCLPLASLVLGGLITAITQFEAIISQHGQSEFYQTPISKVDALKLL